MERVDGDVGFSLVEVIIAMFLLGLVAVALLPALYQGLAISSEQSAIATATRHLNAMVEQARQSPICADLSALVSEKVVEDGSGGSITTSGSIGTCPSTTHTVQLDLTATNSSGDEIAKTSAIIFVP